MNWKPASVGAEPKKLIILGLLVVAAGYFFFSSRNSGDSGATPRPAVTTAPAAANKGTAPRPATRGGMRVTQNGVGRNPREFRPSFKTGDIDPSGIDPTLRLNLLARLQDVKADGATRSLFEISAAPPPELTAKEPAKIKPAGLFVGPMPPGPPPPPPPTPRAPPIPLKFYGFVNPSHPSVKRAFFLDGEDIVVAGEGDLIKKRYKILRIGINSAEVEDTQFKGDNTRQSLPLEAEMSSS